jgi:type IV pilus assembly protein PilA
MFKKLKGNKGFTLIELIVVIAILAILAMLIVPRFMGFTDKGKIAADNATAKTITTATATLLADSTITITTSGTDATIEIPNHTTTSVFDVDNVDQSAATIKTAMEKLIGTTYKSQQTGGDGYLVTIDGTTGDITTVAN